MKRLILVFFILLQILCSCTKNNKNISLNSLFTKTIELSNGQTIGTESVNIGFNQEMISDSTILFNQNFSNKVFTLFDLEKERKLLDFGEKGNGPDQLLGVGSFWFNKIENKLFVYDIPKRELVSCSMDSISSFGYLPKLICRIKGDSISQVFAVAPINDSLLICTGSFKKGAYALFNCKKGTQVSFFGSYPIDDKIKDIPNSLIGIANQSKIYSNSNSKSIVNIHFYCGFIEFLDYENPHKIIKSYQFHRSEFKILNLSNNGRTAALTKTNKFGFNSVSVNSKFIYTLYSGRSVEDFGRESSFGRDIYVFDWEGNPIVHYKLNRDAISITIDSENKNLYICFVDQNYSFEKFKINNL